MFLYEAVDVSIGVTATTTNTHLPGVARIPTAPAGPPIRLGRYELITRLAVGGMAEVYLARHGELSGFKTLVVLKKVLPHLAENPEFISMFLDEARVASVLDHPNVVRIFEVGRAANDYFLAMEVVQGKPLASLIRRALDREKLVEPKLAAFIAAQAAHGLHHAHGGTAANGSPLGLVHRDVSPKNILISFEGGVKVIDFGIARALGRLSETSTGGMKGTVGYMSPEQARSEAVDHRSDIFAIGVVLWESLCCKRLFKKDTDFASMRALIYEPIPRPSSVVKIPSALENIVMKALSRDPALRFQTALEMATALERYVGGAGGAGTSDLGRLMQDYFSADQADWKSLVRTAHEMEESAAPIVSPLKMTATGMTSLSASAGVSVANIEPPRPSRSGLLWRVGMAVLFIAMAAFAGTSLLYTSAPPPPPRPAPALPPPTVERLPSPEPPPPDTAAVVPPRSAAATAKRRKPAPTHKRSSSTRSDAPRPDSDLSDRRPNPF
jgi:serine/threonine-protein kinase